MTGARATTVPVPLSAPDGTAPRLASGWTDVGADRLAQLRRVCPQIETDAGQCAEWGRDWWPLALTWAAAGALPARAAVVARPTTTAETAAVLRVCNQARIPVTPAAGRSGVCGGSVPVSGGVVLDLCGLDGIREVDDTSLLVRVGAGTFGPDLESELRSGHGLTIGHWPQSFDLSTVGGWVACRGAGQYSTRYGKIEDMVVGLEVALADGTVVALGGHGPRSATGPDLAQLLIGSEGTLGVITEVLLRTHAVPDHEARSAWGFAGTEGFTAGLEACRRILRRGATPAVLRLYDPTETERSFSLTGEASLVVLDEGDPALVSAVMAVVAEECRAQGGESRDEQLVERWLEHRNDVSALGALTQRGFVVDTIEVAGRWSVLPALYDEVTAALRALPETLAASAHQSHAYGDGACLYFTFAARPPQDAPASWAEDYYRRAWGVVMDATIAAGAAVSHHHGIGLVRGQALTRSLGPAHGMLAAVKSVLDPHGILNPGKLGLASPFGPAAWP